MTILELRLLYKNETGTYPGNRRDILPQGNPPNIESLSKEDLLEYLVWLEHRSIKQSEIIISHNLRPLEFIF